MNIIIDSFSLVLVVQSPFTTIDGTRNLSKCTIYCVVLHRLYNGHSTYSTL